MLPKASIAERMVPTRAMPSPVSSDGRALICRIARTPSTNPVIGTKHSFTKKRAGSENDRDNQRSDGLNAQHSILVVVRAERAGSLIEILCSRSCTHDSDFFFSRPIPTSRYARDCAVFPCRKVLWCAHPQTRVPTTKVRHNAPQRTNPISADRNHPSRELPGRLATRGGSSYFSVDATVGFNDS